MAAVTQMVPLVTISSTLPGASWRRCRTHYARNLSTKVMPTPTQGRAMGSSTSR